MKTAQSTLQPISGRIEQFRKITPTLATFRVNGIACKAEHHAVPYVERWAKNPDGVYVFDGLYQQSRFGREFVAKHGRLNDTANAPVEEVADNVTISEEKAVQEHIHKMMQRSPDLLTPSHLRWQMEHGPRSHQEAARRLLERMLQAKASVRDSCSPLDATENSGESQGPTSRSDY